MRLCRRTYAAVGDAVFASRLFVGSQFVEGHFSRETSGKPYCGARLTYYIVVEKKFTVITMRKAILVRKNYVYIFKTTHQNKTKMK